LWIIFLQAYTANIALTYNHLCPSNWRRHEPNRESGIICGSRWTWAYVAMPRGISNVVAAGKRLAVNRFRYLVIRPKVKGLRPCLERS